MTDFPEDTNSKRVPITTEKGLEFRRTLKRKSYNQHKKKLEEKRNALDMNWSELSDPEALRKERLITEEYRKGLTEVHSEVVPLLPSEFANDVTRETEYLNRQATELRKKIGERIFEL